MLATAEVDEIPSPAKNSQGAQTIINTSQMSERNDFEEENMERWNPNLKKGQLGYPSSSQL